MQQSSPTPEEPWKESFAILLRCPEGQKPKMIGAIGTGRESEVGYKVHPDFSGKGYMTEALKLFTTLFFTLEGMSFIARIPLYALVLACCRLCALHFHLLLFFKLS